MAIATLEEPRLNMLSSEAGIENKQHYINLTDKNCVQIDGSGLPYKTLNIHSATRILLYLRNINVRYLLVNIAEDSILIFEENVFIRNFQTISEIQIRRSELP